VRRMLLVARREFLATVMTKGFVIGVLILPLLILGLLLLVPLLVSLKPPKVVGSVAVIDRSGPPPVVLPRLQAKIEPAALAESLARKTRRSMERAGRLAGEYFGETGSSAMHRASQRPDLGGDAPEISIEVLPSSADVEAEKEPLRAAKPGDGGRLALIVIEPGVMHPQVREGRVMEDVPYQAFIRTMLDERVQGIIMDALHESIVDARIAGLGVDPSQLRALADVPEVAPRTVTAGGERASLAGMQFLLPAGFILLLMMSAFSGGQYLLTTTIEEKSNRIMEVLLSAVSPRELMIGKIIGQMGVGLLILFIYSGLGLGALITFQLVDVLSAATLAYLIVFFFIAFFLIAAMMAAVGSAVSEVHEAQSLVGPVMMIFLVPWLLMPAIVQNPNSLLAVVLSLTPPVSPFVMVARIAASTTPIPTWQIALSIGGGLAAVAIAAWAAAKIFRIGVLMYGKPPNLGTLIKWVRMA
jgi:ABC-2 type transport system permease protein